MSLASAQLTKGRRAETVLKGIRVDCLKGGKQFQKADNSNIDGIL